MRPDQEENVGVTLVHAKTQLWSLPTKTEPAAFPELSENSGVVWTSAEVIAKCEHDVWHNLIFMLNHLVFVSPTSHMTP